MWVFLVFDRLHLKWPRGKIHCPLWAWVHYLQRQWRLQQHIVPLSFWTAEDVCWWWYQKSLSGFWWSWGRTGKNVSENREHAYWVPPWMTWTFCTSHFCLSYCFWFACLLVCFPLCCWILNGRPLHAERSFTTELYPQPSHCFLSPVT